MLCLGFKAVESRDLEVRLIRGAYGILAWDCRVIVNSMERMLYLVGSFVPVLRTYRFELSHPASDWRIVYLALHMVIWYEVMM
jgi:hypothetical protein